MAKFQKLAAEFDAGNVKNKYYDTKGKDFRASNFKYELLPDFEKKQVQQLARREVPNYIKNMIDMDDMVMDFQYDYGVTIPRGKFMEVFGMGEKEYTAAVEKAEKEAGLNTGELIENNLFGTQFKKNKPQEAEEEFDFNDEPTVEALNKALDDYLAQPAPEKKSASTKKQAAFIHDKSEAYHKLNQAFTTLSWAEEQGLDKISGTDIGALKKRYPSYHRPCR